MFANWMGSFLLSALLSSAGSSAASADASRSCAELVARRDEANDAATRLAKWMERHCPGALEDTDPFCRFQSRSLLERLADLGELKEALAAKGCRFGEVREASAQGRASLIHVTPIPPVSVDSPRNVASF